VISLSVTVISWIKKYNQRAFCVVSPLKHTSQEDLFKGRGSLGVGETGKQRQA